MIWHCLKGNLAGDPAVRLATISAFFVVCLERLVPALARQCYMELPKRVCSHSVELWNFVTIILLFTIAIAVAVVHGLQFLLTFCALVFFFIQSFFFIVHIIACFTLLLLAIVIL